MRYFAAVSGTDKEVFNSFIASSERGHIFQTWEWGEMRKGDGWLPHRFIVKDNGRIKAAATVLQKILPGGWSIFHAPRGPVMDYSDSDTLKYLFIELRSFLSKNKAILLQIDPDIRQSDEAAKDSLVRNGFFSRPSGIFFITQPNHVFRLDISREPDNIYAQFSSSTRRNIRIAQNANVLIETRHDIDAVIIFYRMLKLTSSRKRFLIRPLSYQKRLFKYFISKGYGKVFLAKTGDEYIAARLALRFGDKCWDMYAGSNRKHAELKANHLLVWEMIKWAKSSGCKIFDFRGAGAWDDPKHPDRGIYDFKVKFGPEHCVFIGEYFMVFNEPLYKKYESLYELLLKILRLPKKIRNFLNQRSDTEILAKLTFDKYGENEELEEYSRRAMKDGLGFEEKFLMKHLKLPGKVLIDGCGAGREALGLAKTGFDVTGIDFQPKMLEMARLNSEKLGLKIEFEQMDATKLTFPDRSFDAVVMFGSILTYIPGTANRLKALTEANRILRNGGLVFISVPSKNSALKYKLFYLVMDNLRRLLNAFGIKTMETGDRMAGKVSGRVISKGKCFTHMFSLTELKDNLKTAGFDFVESLSRKEIIDGIIDPASTEKDYFMYVCGRKPGA